MSKKKKRIKIIVKSPNHQTFFRKGPIALHVSEEQKDGGINYDLQEL